MKPLVMVSTRGRERCDTRREDVEVEGDLGAYTIKGSSHPRKLILLAWFSFQNQCFQKVETSNSKFTKNEYQELVKV